MAVSYLKPPSCFQTISIKSGSGSVTVNGNTVNTVSFSVTNTGWVPLGVVALSHNKAILSCYSIGWNDEGGGMASVWASFRNTSSSAQTATVTAVVLFRKE